jgi:hypothetical protein
MPKESDFWPGKTLLGLKSIAKQSRHEREMKILDENARVVMKLIAAHGVGKLLIDGFVVLPVFGGELRPLITQMAERPERTIGESVGVSRFFVLSEEDAPEAVVRCRIWSGDFAMGIEDLEIGTSAGLGDPDALMLADKGFGG